MTTNSQPDALARDAINDAVKPYADYHGDLPDYDDPMRPVYESGIQYAVELLAKELKVTDWASCDGTEEFDGDLGGTLMNIVLAAMPKDEHGEPIYPCDLHTPAPNSAQGSEGEWSFDVFDLAEKGIGAARWHWRENVPLTKAAYSQIVAAIGALRGELVFLATPPTDAAIVETARAEHNCPACPVEARDIGAVLHNLIVQIDRDPAPLLDRTIRKKQHAREALARWRIITDAHFAARSTASARGKTA